MIRKISRDQERKNEKNKKIWDKMSFSKKNKNISPKNILI